MSTFSKFYRLVLFKVGFFFVKIYEFVEFLGRWILTTNHKDIGTLYILFGLFAGFIGTTLSLLIRYELSYPGIQIFDNTLNAYNTVVTSHGLIMVFFCFCISLLFI